MKVLLALGLISCGAAPVLPQVGVGPFALRACESGVFLNAPGLGPAQYEALSEAADYWNSALKRSQFLVTPVDAPLTDQTWHVAMHEEAACGVTRYKWYGAGCITRVEIMLSPSCEKRLPQSTWKTVFRHELGHALGLAHSDNPLSLMAPVITHYQAEPIALNDEELAELHEIYGVK